jgi:hypothetical protein
MSDKLRPLTPEEFMQALGQLNGRSPAVERSLRQWQETVMQACAQSDGPPPINAAAAGYTASYANALGVSATTQAPDALMTQGQVEPVVIRTVPDAEVRNWVVVPGRRTHAHATRSDIAATDQKAPPLALPPALGLNRAIKLMLTPKAYRSIIEPVIADNHHEYYEALKQHEATRWIVIRMYLLPAWAAIRLVLGSIVRLR